MKLKNAIRGAAGALAMIWCTAARSNVNEDVLETIYNITITSAEAYCELEYTTPENYGPCVWALVSIARANAVSEYQYLVSEAQYCTTHIILCYETYFGIEMLLNNTWRDTMGAYAAALDYYLITHC